jgi:hypothetical protein
MDYQIYSIEIEGTKRHCLAILPKEFVVSKGLHNKAIVGFLENGQVDPKEFSENEVFRELLHQVVASQIPALTELAAEGKKVGTGYVYLIDKRTKNRKGDVPVQDIIGAVNFENGILVPDSYLPNKNYKLLTDKGLFQLPFSLEENLLEEIKR